MTGTHSISAHSNPNGQCLSHLPESFTKPTSLCDTSDQRRLKHLAHAEIVWAQGCKDHNGLYPCAELGSEGCEEPDGGDLGGVLSGQSIHF